MANIVIANCWNKDQLFRSDILGVIFIIVGAVWFAVFTVGAPDESLEDLKNSMKRPWFLAYISGQTFILLCLLSTIASSAYYNVRKRFTFAILEPVLGNNTLSKHL